MTRRVLERQFQTELIPLVSRWTIEVDTESFAAIKTWDVTVSNGSDQPLKFSAPLLHSIDQLDETYLPSWEHSHQVAIDFMTMKDQHVICLRPQALELPPGGVYHHRVKFRVLNYLEKFDLGEATTPHFILGHRARHFYLPYPPLTAAGFGRFQKTPCRYVFSKHQLDAHAVVRCTASPEFTSITETDDQYIVDVEHIMSNDNSNYIFDILVQW